MKLKINLKYLKMQLKANEMVEVADSSVAMGGRLLQMSSSLIEDATVLHMLMVKN